MAQKFHIRKDGTPGPCSAEWQCPLGQPLDEHHATAKDAARAFEAQMIAEMLPEGENKKLSNRDFQKLAKVTTDPELQLEIAKTSTDSARKNLARNPETTTEALEAAYIAADSDDTRVELAKHINADWRIMHPDHVAKGMMTHMLAYTGDATSKSKPLREKVEAELNADHLDDNTLKAFIKETHRVALLQPNVASSVKNPASKIAEAISNRNNLLSKAYRTEVLLSSPGVMNSVLVNGGLTRTEFRKLPWNKMDYKLARTPEYLSILSERYDNESLTQDEKRDVARHIVTEPNATTATLRRLSKLGHVAPRSIYRHPNASAQLRNTLKASSKEIQSDVKLQEVAGKGKSLVDLRESLIHSREAEDTKFGVHSERTIVDRAQAKKLGLTDYDVANLFENTSVQGRGIFKYDPKTGVFGGRYDSGD